MLLAVTVFLLTTQTCFGSYRLDFQEAPPQDVKRRGRICGFLNNRIDAKMKNFVDTIKEKLDALPDKVQVDAEPIQEAAFSCLQDSPFDDWCLCPLNTNNTVVVEYISGLDTLNFTDIMVDKTCGENTFTFELVGQRGVLEMSGHIDGHSDLCAIAPISYDVGFTAKVEILVDATLLLRVKKCQGEGFLVTLNEADFNVLNIDVVDVDVDYGYYWKNLFFNQLISTMLAKLNSLDLEGTINEILDVVEKEIPENPKDIIKCKTTTEIELLTKTLKEKTQKLKLELE